MDKHHCKGSELYREQRIPTHVMQTRATIMVIKYFSERYHRETLARHQMRALTAIQQVEGTIHAR